MFKKQRVVINEKKFYIHPIFNIYAAFKKGEIANIKTKRILKMFENIKNGYVQFIIYDKKLVKPKMYNQHRFVFECFYGLIPKEMEEDHVDFVPTNNCIKNLQLLSHL